MNPISANTLFEDSVAGPKLYNIDKSIAVV